MKKFYGSLLALALLVMGCAEDDPVIVDPVDDDPIVYTSGSADFTTYVALGNSLTAGFSDNALFIEGQTNSFPNMLAQNFALAGGGTFNTPFMADNLGGATYFGQPILGNRLILSFASGSPAPVEIAGTGTTEISNTVSFVNGPMNNMGVPGATSYHLVAPGYGDLNGVPVGQANPYYARFATSSTSTVLGDAAIQDPTFFSLWIGNNDVLGFAATGGTGIDQSGNLDPSTYAGNDISDQNLFASVYNTILQTLTANGAEGVVANIPDVLGTPYFTTVPFNSIPLDQATADVVNAAYAAYNGGLAQLQQGGLISAEELAQRTINFTAGNNAVVLIDEDLTDLTAFNPALINMRQATPEDLLVLPSSSFLGTLANPQDPTSINGVAVPLADNWVVTPQEQMMIDNAIAGFNQTIEALAAQYDIALVDAKALNEELETNGLPLSDGSLVTTTFATGGAYSLDGVHPSPRGYAIIANAFTEAINAKYGSNMPLVNPLDFKGLYID